jgi:predicted NBD/HSP70 family sugar kinase
MDNGLLYRSLNQADISVPAPRKGDQMLRLIRAAQPINRTEIVERLKVDKSTVTEIIRPLIARGILRETNRPKNALERRSKELTFNDDDVFFAGLNLGVRRSQVGTTTLGGEIHGASDFETPTEPTKALAIAREHLESVVKKNAGRELAIIGVSVPGMTDAERQGLVFAPNLKWKNVDIAAALKVNDKVRVVVENDSTAAALFEARLKIRDSADGLLSNFILVRSGTGIGVGLVIGSEVYRGSGLGRGVAGEFGHMTIVAGGRQCVCGNRGCWERYASAAAAGSLYVGDRTLRRGETVPRFVEIVTKAENGEMRSRRTLEMIGDYLGIGIANVIMGIGIPRVIISGRLVYAWRFIEEPMNAAIDRSIIGRTEGWSVEAGKPVGSAIGGALEVAIDEYLKTL